MNFTCDKCQRRYSIADEKVRGKTVKVRCKHCQNVISVEGPPAEVEESTRVVSLADVERLRAQAAEEEASAAAASAPAASAAPAAQQSPWEDDEPTRAAPARDTRSPWFVMVKNQQQGPLDADALRELVASGAVNARSYFWQQGLADWKRGADIPELAEFFAPPPAPPAPEPVRRAPEPPRRAAAPQPEPEPAWQQPAAEPEQPAWGASESSQEPAWAASSQEPEQDGGTPWQQDPEPEPAPRQARGAAANNGPQLGELFSDLDLPGRSEEGELPQEGMDDGGGEQDPFAQQDEPATEIAAPSPAPAKGKKKKKPQPEGPGEHTRVAMAQSGVTRRNPWWKVALFVVVLLVLPVAALFILDQFQVVPVTVTRVNAQGKPVKQSVFSAEGAGALRDKLLGRQPPPPPPVEPAPAEQPKPAAAEKRSPESGAATKPPAEEKKPEDPAASEELKAAYAHGDKQDVGPAVRKDAEVAATDSSAKSGPPPEELQKAMGRVQPAIKACIDAELKKNPKFRGGKVMMLATVGSSGVVKKVSFDSTEVDGSTVGTCIKARAKKMVFSSFEGDDVELQIPLVLGTAM